MIKLYLECGDYMLDEYLQFAKDIAYYAKKVMLDGFNNKLDLSFKDDKTVVTEVDRDINRYLIDRVKEKYNTHSVIGEEEVYYSSSKYVWVCDPLDGTGMFVNHIPVFVFSLALVYDGEVVVGVVYDPSMDKLYSATKGNGAFCNDIRISVNDKHLGSLGYRTNVEIFNNDLIDEVSLIADLKKQSKISSIGSVARSCMAIAAGDFSCDVFPGSSHGNCDIAASTLIVSEAGGCVTNFYGDVDRYDKNIKGAIISNGVSHNEILSVVKKYLK